MYACVLFGVCCVEGHEQETVVGWGLCVCMCVCMCDASIIHV
jgi:hypothetical protein